SCGICIPGKCDSDNPRYSRRRRNWTCAASVYYPHCRGGYDDVRSDRFSQKLSVQRSADFGVFIVCILHDVLSAEIDRYSRVTEECGIMEQFSWRNGCGII